MDAWAEYVVSSGAYIAEIPDGVTFEAAASLPVAGLTALAALDRGQRLLGARVLVTGVSGGVGAFALQLAKAAGARVSAQVRTASQVELATRLGAEAVLVGSDAGALAHAGLFRHIIDGVGGDLWGALVGALEKGGTLVSYGITAGAEGSVKLYPDLFGGGGRKQIYGLTLYSEVEDHPSSEGLERLLYLVQAGVVTTSISVVESWDQAQQVASDFLDRRFHGKAVLTL